MNMIKTVRYTGAVCLLGLLFWAAVQSHGFAQEELNKADPKLVPERWITRMQREVDNKRIPGALLIVQSPDWGLRIANVGVSSYATGKPMQVDMPFRVGPLTRTMISASLLQMEHEWKLRLDQKLSDLLGYGVHPEANEITLKDCLMMSSGIYDYRNIEALGLSADPKFDRLRYTPQKILAEVIGSNPKLVVDPGTYAYSDTDYLIAGLIAEKIDQKPLAEILKQRVFDKCGMKKSWFDTSERELPDNMIRGYTGIHSSTLAERTMRYPTTPAAAICSPDDVLRFMQALFESDKLLHPHSYARMTKLICDYNGRPEDARGLGLMERLTGRGTFRGVEGAIPGYYCCVGYYMHRDTYILLFINTSDDPWVGRLMYDSILRQISGAPCHMRPKSGKTISSGKTTLSWDAGLLYGTYAVYVGESEKAVCEASMEKHDGVRLYVTDENTYSYEVDNLAPGKEYFWRVDTVRSRPYMEKTNDYRRYQSLKEYYPDIDYEFVPEKETIQGPVFRFTTD